MSNVRKACSRRRSLALLVAIPLLSACATSGPVQIQVADLVRAGDYGSAISTLEAARDRRFRSQDQLLYFLELAMLLHLDGQYAKSNEVFEQAKRLGELYYAVSISGEGLSLLSNDYALDYAGENFERTMIHLFSALNYELMGQYDEALVEIRQMGDYLRKLQVDSTNENQYQEDAFGRFMGAMLYEESGDYNGAFVDYKKSLSAYEDYGSTFKVARPPMLLSSAEGLATRLGRWAENDLAPYGDAAPRELPAGSGEVVILHYNGLAPRKVDQIVTVAFGEAWAFANAWEQGADDADYNTAAGVATSIANGDIISVAFPKFRNTPYAIKRMQVSADGAESIDQPVVVEDIGAIAKKDLQDRIWRVRGKAIARAAIKYALQKAAEAAASEAADEMGQYGDLFEVATKAVMTVTRTATEKADKRSWYTLPDKIFMASAILPEGSHDLSFEFYDANGQMVESQVRSGVDVHAGRRTFLVVRTAK